MGTPVAFSIALVSVIAWALSGPALGFSETWQLSINTTTTIVTFLMVFLIQATQNRQEQAIQEKLDAILGEIDQHNDLIGKETEPDE